MVSWMVTAQKVEAAIKRIVEVAHPQRLILFGSYVRGEITPNSDLDILVVTGDDVKNVRKESVRIRRALKGISMPVDIIITPESKLRELAQTPGFIYREALMHGKVVYEAV